MHSLYLGHIASVAHALYTVASTLYIIKLLYNSSVSIVTDAILPWYVIYPIVNRN